MTEFAELGAHCSLSSCREKDFLPFTCHLCGKKFCHRHHMPSAHDCQGFDSSDRIVPECPLCGQKIPILPGDDPNEKVSQHIDAGCPQAPTTVASTKGKRLCSQPGCSDTSLVRVPCARCGRIFCLAHRHEMDHECVIPGEKDEKKLTAQKKLAAQREALLKKQKKKDEKREKDRVALSGYRGDFGTAGGEDWKGPGKVPVPDQFHVVAVYPSESKVPAKRFIFPKRWVAGKVLDSIAAEGRIRNENSKANLPLSKKLVLVSLESGEQLPMSKTLEEIGHELEDYGVVILEYADVEIPQIVRKRMKASLKSKKCNIM